MRALLLTALSAVALAGCNDFIPTGGPSIKEVGDESQAAARYGFMLVDVNSDVVAAMDAAPHRSLRELFPDDAPITPRIGPGDVLSVSIYESGVGELFAPPSAQEMPYGTTQTTLPEATVDRTGVIAVPFAGTIAVAGMTPAQVRSEVERRLKGKAIRPQVLVSVTKDVTNVVTLTGAVKAPGRYVLTAASETLLQIIAIAGGPTGLPGDTIVHFTRGKREARFRLSELVAHPTEDMHVWPGDYVDLNLDPRNFLIYGAVAQAGAFSLASDGVTLAQAISRAGGPREYQADSRGIFVFRYEYPQVIGQMPASQVIAPQPATGGDAKSALGPVIYKINLKQAAGIFYASEIRLRDKDLIFVPAAPWVDWQKYLDILRMTASPITQGTTSGVEMDRAF